MNNHTTRLYLATVRQLSQRLLELTEELEAHLKEQAQASQPAQPHGDFQSFSALPDNTIFHRACKAGRWTKISKDFAQHETGQLTFIPADEPIFLMPQEED